MTGSWEVWGVIAVVLLNGYCFGASCVERFVNYATWPLIPPAAFQGYHRAQSPRIRLLIVVPLLMTFLLQVVLLILCWRDRLPLRALWVMLGASVMGGISTGTIQIPIHLRLERDGYADELIRRLLRSDWIRKGADLVRIAATVVLLRQWMWR